MIPKPNHPYVSVGTLHIASYKDGDWRKVDANAFGFKVSLLFGGRSKEGVGGNSLLCHPLFAPSADGCQTQRGSWTN
jgi:hypothetical protein